MASPGTDHRPESAATDPEPDPDPDPVSGTLPARSEKTAESAFDFAAVAVSAVVAVVAALVVAVSVGTIVVVA